MGVDEFETIVAQVTPPGYGGVGIIRVSGSKSLTIARAILTTTPKPRYALLSNFYGANKQILDEGIAIYFPGPNSYSGEDILELHTHGGPVILDSLVARIITLGARLANPGEFTERAFLNGRLDLAQAESIIDIINASSKEAATSALRSLQGQFSNKIHSLVAQITSLRTNVEAAIDFADEDIEIISLEKIANGIASILQNLAVIKKNAQQGVLLREGIRVAIIGKPNVGKSSLLNYFCGKESAIVTNIPGTTRDVIKEYINLEGLPLHIIDTAGLRESTDKIEQEGMKRTWQEVKNADFILLMVDNDELDLEQYQEFLSKLIIVRNKIDLTAYKPHIEDEFKPEKIYISVKSGKGIDLLKKHLRERVGFKSTEGTFIARRRHLDALQRAESYLLSAKQHPSFELVAEELRLAQNTLGEITGEVYPEDLLNKIFAEFCIGK